LLKSHLRGLPAERPPAWTLPSAQADGQPKAPQASLRKPLCNHCHRYLKTLDMRQV